MRYVTLLPGWRDHRVAREIHTVRSTAMSTTTIQVISKLTMQSAILLPSEDVLRSVEGKVLPILDSSLLVEDGWRE